MEDEQMYFFVVRRTSQPITFEETPTEKPCEDAFLDLTTKNMWGAPQWVMEVSSVMGMLLLVDLGSKIVVRKLTDQEVSSELVPTSGIDGVIEIYDTWRE